MTLICLSPNGTDVYTTDAIPDTLLVATLNGIQRLERDGAALGVAWTPKSMTLEELHISSITREPTRGWLFAGVHGSGLYRSKDEGATWQRTMQGLDHEHVFSLNYVNSPRSLQLYAGTEPAHLYRSDDYGERWHELHALRDVPSRARWSFPAAPHDPHVKHVTADPRDSRILYVCIEQGAVVKSTDGGESFHELAFVDDTYKLNKDTHRVVFKPGNADEIYLDGGDGISFSRDAGLTWEHLTTSAMRIAYPDQLYCVPDEPGVMFVAGGGTPPSSWRQTGDAKSAIARSEDGGRTWRQVQGGLPEHLAGNIEAVTMTMWNGGYGFFAGTTDGEIFASFDKGANWHRIADNLAPITKCVHRRNLDTGRAKVAQTQARA